MLFHDLLLDRVVEYGSNPALIRGDTTLSYAEVGERVHSVAQGLAGAGLKAGERVAIYLNKRPEGVISYFASSLCGAVFVPVNPVLKAAQVKHILNDCAVSVLVTSAAQAQAL